MTGHKTIFTAAVRSPCPPVPPAPWWPPPSSTLAPGQAKAFPDPGVSPAGSSASDREPRPPRTHKRPLLARTCGDYPGAGSCAAISRSVVQRPRKFPSSGDAFARHAGRKAASQTHDASRLRKCLYSATRPEDTKVISSPAPAWHPEVV